MTRSELVKRLKAKRGNLYIKDVESVVEVVLSTMSDALIDGDRVELRGFGSFSTRERAPTTARNPRTGEYVQLGARRSIYFRMGKSLKELMN